MIQQNLGGSPKKETQAEIAQSKVQLLRHLLFTSLKQVYYPVEQTSCIQVLEDFLRNGVKSLDDVKAMKNRELDSRHIPGLLGRFTMKVPRGSVRLADFFKVALES